MPNGLESAIACLGPAEFRGVNGPVRRAVLRSFLRAWPSTGIPIAKYATRWNVRRRIEVATRAQFKRDMREGYGFIGIAAASVFATIVLAGIGWLTERILTHLFPDHDKLDPGACDQVTQWSEATK